MEAFGCATVDFFTTEQRPKPTTATLGRSWRTPPSICCITQTPSISTQQTPNMAPEPYLTLPPFPPLQCSMALLQLLQQHIGRKAVANLCFQHGLVDGVVLRRRSPRCSAVLRGGHMRSWSLGLKPWQLQGGSLTPTAQQLELTMMGWDPAPTSTAVLPGADFQAGPCVLVVQGRKIHRAKGFNNAVLRHGPLPMYYWYLLVTNGNK